MANVLGISIGTRTMGIAILQHGELVEWRVKTFWARWSTTKMNAILGVLLDRMHLYKVDQIIVKVPLPSHQSGNITELIASVQMIATMRKIPITITTIKELKKRHTDAYVGKEVIIEAIGQKYPELLEEYAKAKKNRNSYFAKVFEAIECAEMETGL